MHKSKREGLRRRTEKARRIEDKIQALSFSVDPEARKENKRMSENRHWYDRNLKGYFRTGNDRGHGNVKELYYV